MEEKTVKAIEHDREKRREILLAYFTKRRDSISGMMDEHFKATDEINCCQMEVYFAYNAIISDIKNNRLD